MTTKKEISTLKPDDLKSISCSMDEQETTFTAYRSDTSWNLWVSDNVMLTKIKKLWGKAPEDCKLVRIERNRDGGIAGYEFEISKKCVGLRAPKVLSEEQRAALRDRLTQHRENIDEEEE